MIKLHNNSTYHRIYDKLSMIFIDSYCMFRRTGLNSKESVVAARICVQIQATHNLKRNDPNSKITIQAYHDLKDDTLLVEKAIKSYYYAEKE